jgi:hypothetical protein
VSSEKLKVACEAALAVLEEVQDADICDTYDTCVLLREALEDAGFYGHLERCKKCGAYEGSSCLERMHQ